MNISNNEMKIILREPYYNNFYNNMKKKNVSELLEILKNTINQNAYAFERLNDDIKNLNNLKPYDKYYLINSLDFCKAITILNYLIKDKL